MGLVQVGCPLCGGPFQVDTAHAGMQVQCPHCQGAVLLGALEEPAGPPSGPMPPPAPADRSGPPPAPPASSSPPVGSFPPRGGSSSGPPPVGSSPPPSSPPPGAPKPVSTGPPEPADSRFPPGYVPPKSSVTSKAVSSPPSAPPPPPSSAPPAGDFRFPPGMNPPGKTQPAEPEVRTSSSAPPAAAPPSSKPKPAVKKPAEPAADQPRENKPSSPKPVSRSESSSAPPPGPASPSADRYPPGMGPPGSSPPAATSAGSSSPPKPASRTGSEPAKKVSLDADTLSDDDLLPPGVDLPEPIRAPVENKLPLQEVKKPAEPSNRPKPVLAPDAKEKTDHLLPPGASGEGKSTSGLGLDGPLDDDDLLPHAATEGPVGKTTQPQLAMKEVPLPTMSENLTNQVVNPEFSVKEPTRKIIQVDGEEIELRVLSPEEKAQRRKRRNLITIAFSVVVIAIIVWVVTS